MENGIKVYGSRKLTTGESAKLLLLGHQCNNCKHGYSSVCNLTVATRCYDCWPDEKVCDCWAENTGTEVLSQDEIDQLLSVISAGDLDDKEDDLNSNFNKTNKRLQEKEEQSFYEDYLKDRKEYLAKEDTMVLSQSEIDALLSSL